MTRMIAVDDHDENLYLLRMLLESRGHAVEAASNGAEALDMARRDPPDLIISDILMPVMDGFSLCREWRADDRLRHVPFIFYTATYTDPRDERLALDLGADAFIRKPSEPEDLLAVVNDVLTRTNVGRPVASSDPPGEAGSILRQYSEVLVRKLEKKMLLLEEANAALERENVERARVEDALRESEERFRGLFETMSQGVVYQGADGAIAMANPAAERLLGHSIDQMRGRTSLDPRWETVHEDGSDFPGDEHPAMVALRTREPVTGVIMGVRHAATDERRWITVDALPQVLPAEASATSVFAIFTDITERTVARDTLRRQLAFDELIERLLSHIASAPADEIDGHLAATMEPLARFMDADSAIVFRASDDRASWGAAYSWAAPGIRNVAEGLKNIPMGTLPWAEAELLAGRTVLLRSADDLPKEAGDLRRLWEAQRLRSALLVPLRGRGSLIRSTLALFAVSDGRPWEPQDVRQVEQAGEAIASALERKHVEDSLRASDEQLRQSQKMEAVGQLAGGIAHDFNNLLTAILGYSDLLLARSDLLDSPARQDIEEIKHAAERAATLTGQILSFSRRRALRPSVVSLDGVVDGMESLLRRTLGEDVDLVIRHGPGTGHVEVDVHQFEQVLMNLALNARDAMASGGRLTIESEDADLDEEYCRAHPEAVPGRYVMLAVSDTGQGMDEATRLRVFEPFFTTKAPGQGTGLGLATVYGTVKQSNGSISVSSAPGRGSTFRILLPRTTAPTGQTESTVQATGAARRETATILLVEDEASLRRLAVRILTDHGYRVLSAGTGEEALRVVAEAGRGLDLVVTDMVLPGGMQGRDLARSLQSATPGLPVLYVSGYARDSIIHAGRLDEGTDLLEKPFGPEALATMVGTLLDRSRGPGSGPSSSG